jgi:flagellar M-ring protein FliF
METLSSTAQASLASPARAGASGSMTAVSDAEKGSAVSTVSGSLPAVQRFFAQPAVKRSMPAAIAIFAFLALLLFWAALSSKEMRSVSSGMDSADSQLAYEALLAGNYDVEIDVVTGQILVESNKYQEAKIFLASQGLPRSATDGGVASLSDDSSMTTSQFMEQVRYQGAMEKELAASITRIGTIETARVHLAAPKQSVFVRDRQPAKASVIVTPFPGRVVDQSQVQSIVHLVSSSVPYLALEDVTVVDHFGNLLTKSGTDVSSSPIANNAQFVAQREAELASRLRQLLSPVLGQESMRVAVNLELDFTEVESTLEQYFDAESDSPEIRSEVLTEDTQTGLKAAEGIPGALSNVPPDEPEIIEESEELSQQEAETQTTSSRSQTTRNYELDKEVRYVKQMSGEILSLSAAIIVDEQALKDLATRRVLGVPAAGVSNADGGLAAEFAATNAVVEDISSAELADAMDFEIERFRQLVVGAIPYSEDRGDNLSITTAPFFRQEVSQSPTQWYQDQQFLSWGKHGMTVAALLAFLLIVVRPLLRAYLPDTDTVSEELMEALADGELSEADRKALEDGESLDEIKAKLKPKKSSISADMLDTANSYDDKVAVVRLLVAEDAGRVANVLKKMIDAK